METEVLSLKILEYPLESNEAGAGKNELTVETIHPYRHSTVPIIVLVIAYLAVLIVGVTGNFLVIITVAKTPRMRTVTNYFITNLALADLLVLVFCLPPTLISNIYVPWVLGWFLCKTVPYIQGVTVCASIYSLVAISLDRFLAIWSPLRCQFQITKKKARLIILLIWMWAASLALPWILFFDLSHADEKQPSLLFCVEHWPTGMSGNVYFVLVNLILFYLFPLGIISLCYFFIWLRVWRRQLPDGSAMSQVELIHQRAKVSVLKMLIVVVAVFTISWLPLYAIFVRIKLLSWPMGKIEGEVLDLALPIAQWLGASNSCINPILYAFFNVKFRRALLTLFKGYEWTRHPTPHSDKPNVMILRKHLQSQIHGCRIRSSDYDVTTL